MDLLMWKCLIAMILLKYLWSKGIILLCIHI